MNETTHTREPWINNGGQIETDGEGRDENERVIGAVGTVNEQSRLDTANANRIVACVNACAGLNPEAFAELVKSAELVSALLFGEDKHGVEFETATNRLRSAIAKAKEG